MSRLILVLAVLLHLSAGVLYLGAGLLAPDGAVLVLRAVWLVLLVALVLLWRRRPSAALVVPPVAVVVFLASVTAGEQLLGWTA